MNILLTGASSRIGSTLIRSLSKCSGVNVTAMVHRSLVNITGCEIRKADLSNPESLVKAVEGIDAVVHMAALTRSVRESEYFRINVEGTQNLIDACKLAGVKKIIFLSSRAACEEGGGYSRSKLKAEQCVRESGLQWLILRPSEVYGQGSGDAINRLIQWIRKYPLVPVLGTGQARFSPVYIDDLVSAIKQSLLDETLENETILLAGPEEMTLDELVDRTSKCFGVSRSKLRLPVGFVRLGSEVLAGLGVKVLVPDQVPRLLCSKDRDISKASSLISFSPRKLEEGIAAYCLVRK